VSEKERDVPPALALFERNHGIRVMTLTHAQETFISWTVDILIYVLVLNLFAEFWSEKIVIDSFWVTILTAALFKALLVALEKGVFGLKDTLKEKGLETVGLAVALALLFAGKLAIVEIVNAVFGQVELEGLVPPAIMILTMIVVSMVTWQLFRGLGGVGRTDPGPLLGRGTGAADSVG
jgi:hypothetical protein